MEIPLDPAFIAAVLDDERRQAVPELQTAGPLGALTRSQARHDRRIDSARDVGTLDCRAGCSWCCHFSIDVRPVEAFVILDFIARELAADEQARVHAAVRTRAAAMQGLDPEQRMLRNVRCAFLGAEGRCTIYAVRPQTCRNYHATDVTGCRRSFEDPADLEIDPDFAPYVYQAGGAHVEAFSESLRDAGYDVGAYEFNGALVAALDDSASRQRFLAKQRAFALPAEDVEPEFREFIDPT